MARPTAASAAATAMMKKANICPVPVRNWRLKATRVRVTAFSISSMLMSATMTLRRVRKPIVPIAKRIAPKIR